MSSLRETLGTLAIGALLGSLFFFVPLWGPRVVFWRLLPHNPRAMSTGTPLFSVSDLVVLIAFLSVANVCVGLLRNQTSRGYLILLACVTNMLAVLVWIQGFRFMRRYSIRQPRCRLLLQIVLYPASVIVVGETIMSGTMLQSALLEAMENGFPHGIRAYVFHPLTVAGASGLCVSALVIVVARCLFARFSIFGADA